MSRLIDADKLLKEFEKAKEGCNNLKELLFFDGVMAIVDNQPTVGGWIPVSERMPTKEEYNKNSGRFIATDGNRVYQSLFDTYDKKQFINITYLGNCKYFEEVDERVIAWQPLPEPYTPELLKESE